MSASQIFSSAATSRHFIFPPMPAPDVPEQFGLEPPKKPAAKVAQALAVVGNAPKLSGVVPASRLEVRPAPEMVSSGIAQLDLLTGGIARGCLTEICGTASSGKTTILLSVLAQSTQRGEVCALVDTGDAFHPASAAAAGVDLSRLLWIRCEEKPAKYPSADRTRDSSSNKGMPLRNQHSGSQRAMISGTFKAGKTGSSFRRWEARLGQLLKVTDLLLQSNGFGMIALDLSDVPPESARRIPMASWFRFRRAVERTPTALLVMEQQPIAGSCSSTILKLSAAHAQKTRLIPAKLTHTELLDQFAITAQVAGSRLERQSQRKPMQSTANFKSRAAWAG